MLILTLLIAVLAVAFGVLAKRFTREPLEQVAVALFLAVLAPIYAPQLSHLLFGTLGTAGLWVSLGLISGAFAGGLYFAGRRVGARVDAATVSPPILRQSTFASLQTALRSPLIATLLIVALAASGLSLWISIRFSQFGWDGWVYHAAAMAWFHQQNAITPAPWMPWIIGYPKNIEFLGFWVFRFEGNDGHIDMVNLLLHWIAIPFAYGLGRRIGLQPGWAFLAALLYFLTPVLISQSWSGYIDGVFADSVVMMLYFLFTWMQSQGATRAVWAILLGCALGHLAQIKGTGLHLVFIIGGFVLVHEWLTGQRSKLVQTLALVAAPTALLGAGWYLHTWWVMGNPLYPFRIMVPGTHTALFEGTMDLKDSMLANLGQRINLDEPWPLRYFRMFQSSGWGLQFFAFGLPATALCLVKGNKPLRWLLVFAAVYLIVTPFSFVDRYAAVVTAVGTLSFAFVMQEHVRNLIWSRLLAAAAIVAATASVLPLAMNMDPQSLGPRNPPAIEQMGEAEGYKRFALVNAADSPQRIGIVDLARGADNPHWYFYFGSRWDNPLEVFDPSQASQYDFAVCASDGGRCREITETGLFDRVIEERGVEVYRRASH